MPQIVEQIERYRRLVNSTEVGIDVFIKHLVAARARARKYSEKVRYYTERLMEHIGSADEATKALRDIQLREVK